MGRSKKGAGAPPSHLVTATLSPLLLTQDEQLASQLAPWSNQDWSPIIAASNRKPNYMWLEKQRYMHTSHDPPVVEAECCHRGPLSLSTLRSQCFRNYFPHRCRAAARTSRALSHPHVAMPHKKAGQGIKIGGSSLCFSLLAGKTSPQAPSAFPLGASWLQQHDLSPSLGERDRRRWLRQSQSPLVLDTHHS